MAEKRMPNPPKIKVRFVKPGDKIRPRKKTFEEIGLTGQMSQFYSLKATLEALFGRPIYYELKETTDLANWRRASKRLLQAIALALRSSVQVADEEWFAHIERTIAHGMERTRMAQTASELFAGLSATLIELVFTQAGFMPTRSGMDKKVPLSKDYWTLDNFRTVQYVQSPRQKNSQREYLARRTARQSQPTP